MYANFKTILLLQMTDRGSALASAMSRLRPTTTRVTGADDRVHTERDQGKTRDPGEDSRTGPGYVVDTEPDLSCDEIIPGLYLGSQDVAAAPDILR